MRVTIVVNDGLIIVDGVARDGFDLTDLQADGVHAVQWYDDKGEIEYHIDGRHSNQPIDTLEDFEIYVQAWRDYVPPAPEEVPSVE